TSRSEQKELLKLSPFELKDKLIDIASETERTGDAQMLNAGRGNPNWLCTTPREAFAFLLQFALQETQSGFKLPDTGWFAKKEGIADRLNSYLSDHDDAPGINLLKASVEYGVDTLAFDPDSFIYEMVEGIIGCMYPVPDRMLRCSEKVVHDFLVQEMCSRKQPEGRFDIFAVEGGTAAMCYIFDSLVQNNLLHKGDTIALGVPTFTPYIEIPHFDRYAFNVVNIDASVERRADGTHSWQYSDEEIDKLADKRIKTFFLVNPSNPPSYAMRESSVKRLVDLVKTKRPDLMIITDDVYGTFVPGFRSLLADLPHNTIFVYSYSKHFGCTGWRLGVIALHQKNIFDDQLAQLPAKDKDMLNKRYGSISLDPERVKFIDRMVADSRQVALNHTAGLSTPQQVQMVLFSLFALTDSADSYKSLCQLIVRRRHKALWDGLKLKPIADADFAAYYTELDIMVWAEKEYGADFVKFLRENYECTDVLFRVAEHSGVVLMHGGGFGGPDWSVRVSLANLQEDTYPKIGRYLKEATESYVKEWKDAHSAR
ncbi:MAG TPA: bifunctional aspartate transaminase/aspartate 4-decarboxylase, partial [Puia sp.]|nr:bifunctional aspartate transaminase/aspartate 4-decarboxylase [Puia sp.]